LHPFKWKIDLFLSFKRRKTRLKVFEKNNSYNELRVKPSPLEDSFPSSAKETLPVSSDTTSIRASLCSVNILLELI
jgi:hypothetical protein